MKVIIPVAGAGLHLRPHTHTQPKPLIPVAGKPILGHIIDRLLEAELHKFIFVVGYMGEKIKAYVLEHYGDKINPVFVHQEPRLGLGQAVWLCKDQVGDEPLMISLGDTIVDIDLKQFIHNRGSCVAVQDVEDPRQFGVAVQGDNGYITSLVEKPNIPKSNLALVGLYKIEETRAFMAALEHRIVNNLRTRNEFHLTDGLMTLVEQGIPITPIRVNNWYDCGRKSILLETNRILLRKMSLVTPTFAGSVIIPPVFIPSNCEIINSIVGPNVALAEHAVIRKSIVSDTIMGAYSRLESIILQDSIVGNDTTLIGRHHAINIGDNTEIDFNQ